MTYGSHASTPARGGPPGRSAPALNLKPADLLRELVHHSLDAHLREIFYASLAAGPHGACFGHPSGLVGR